ncbi:FAD-binding protein [Serratia marcescens]|uniref:FAD-binding protein n=1 Tax=Serratia marcescens TaxID=615 RepID=A0A939NLH8_SERMA|nr:FAD-binding protein [Serratia marcescens]
MRSHTVAAEGAPPPSPGSRYLRLPLPRHRRRRRPAVRTGRGRSLRASVPARDDQLEQWGCPWSRKPDGSVNVRRFGGMKIERTCSPPTRPASTCCTPCSRPLKYPQIQRLTSTSCWISRG